MIAFAASVIGDVLYNPIIDLLPQFMARSTARNMDYMLEDGFKFLGIILWLSYFVVTAAASLGYRKQGP
jgi:hypothetical protein